MASGNGGAGAAPPALEGAPAPRLPSLREGVLALAIGACLVGIALLAGGVLAFRIGWLDIDMARDGARTLALVVFMTGLGLAIAGGVWSVLARSSKGVILAIAAATACGTGGGWLYGQGQLIRSMPPIWDLQTDWANPVPLSDAVMAERTRDGAPPLGDTERVGVGSGAWSGLSFAEAQKRGFPLGSMVVNATPAAAIEAVETSAKRLGWKVAASDPAAGRLEAISTSRWYGLKIDVVVRAAPAGAGARIDVRAANRTPGGDSGALARRIEVILNDTAFALRGT